MTTARLIVEAGQVQVFAPYALKEIIKSLPNRRWDKLGKCWIIPVRHADLCGNALRAAGCEVFLTRPDGTPWTSGRPDAGHRSTPGPDWAEGLLDAVGPQRIDKVYRALSRVLHPDAGGDMQLMQQLNIARDKATGLSSGRWSV